jgi:plastocyanin
MNVKKGTKVVWENLDESGHTVTSSDGLFDSNTIGGNKVFGHVFEKAGTFGYLGVIHPSMAGKSSSRNSSRAKKETAGRLAD